MITPAFGALVVIAGALALVVMAQSQVIGQQRRQIRELTVDLCEFDGCDADATTTILPAGSVVSYRLCTIHASLYPKETPR